MIVELIEYRRPNGQQRTVYAQIPAPCDPTYRAVCAAGGNLSIETLSTGEVAVAIEDRQVDDDYDIEIVPPRVSIEPTLAAMLERFDAAKFGSWRSKLIDASKH